VRERVAQGVDHIKIFTTGGVSSTGSSLAQSNYSAEEIAAIIERGDAAVPQIMAKVAEARIYAGKAARVRESGVRIAVGTDFMHGFIGYEMQWPVEHGWSPLEALVAGTRHGANASATRPSACCGRARAPTSSRFGGTRWRTSAPCTTSPPSSAAGGAS
jgi:imidazolonepropionase-like amidohydrolase